MYINFTSVCFYFIFSLFLSLSLQSLIFSPLPFALLETSCTLSCLSCVIFAIRLEIFGDARDTDVVYLAVLILGLGGKTEVIKGEERKDKEHDTGTTKGKGEMWRRDRDSDMGWEGG